LRRRINSPERDRVKHDCQCGDWKGGLDHGGSLVAGTGAS
jgi:hypothetical protein